MSISEAAGIPPAVPDKDPTAPDGAGKFSLSEDWLAVVVGLVLLALALTGLIPPGLIP